MQKPQTLHSLLQERVVHQVPLEAVGLQVRQVPVAVQGLQEVAEVQEPLGLRGQQEAQVPRVKTAVLVHLEVPVPPE